MPVIYLNTASGEGQKVFEVVPAAAGGGDNARSRKERGWVSGMVGITGYSLAGLFAVYAIYRTDVFSGGCMSGSVWFPGFKEYIFSRELKRRPDCIYFSLGGQGNQDLQLGSENGSREYGRNSELLSG